MYSNAGWASFQRKQHAEDNRALAGEREEKRLAKGPKCWKCNKPLAIPEAQYGGMHKVCRDEDNPKLVKASEEERVWTVWPTLPPITPAPDASSRTARIRSHGDTTMKQ